MSVNCRYCLVGIIKVIMTTYIEEEKWETINAAAALQGLRSQSEQEIKRKNVRRTT